MRLLLDTNVLQRLCLPQHPGNRPLAEWLAATLTGFANRVTVYVPEISDYEARRGLLHLAFKEGKATHPRLARLEELARLLDYLPLSTPVMRRAAQIWAEARHSGRPASPRDALDGDAILAAQALEVGGTVVTANTDHFAGVVPAQRWEEVAAKLGATPSP